MVPREASFGAPFQSSLPPGSPHRLAAHSLRSPVHSLDALNFGAHLSCSCSLLCLFATLILVLQRDKRGMAVFHAGLHEEQFKFIAYVYTRIKARLQISDAIPVFLAEDETCVKKTVRWLPKNDTLLGFCGVRENH